MTVHGSPNRQSWLSLHTKALSGFTRRFTTRHLALILGYLWRCSTSHMRVAVVSESFLPRVTGENRVGVPVRVLRHPAAVVVAERP